MLPPYGERIMEEYNWFSEGRLKRFDMLQNALKAVSLKIDIPLEELMVVSGAALFAYGLRNNFDDIDVAISKERMDAILDSSLDIFDLETQVEKKANGLLVISFTVTVADEKITIELAGNREDFGKDFNVLSEICLPPLRMLALHKVDLVRRLGREKDLVDLENILKQINGVKVVLL